MGDYVLHAPCDSKSPSNLEMLISLKEKNIMPEFLMMTLITPI